MARIVKRPVSKESVDPAPRPRKELDSTVCWVCGARNPKKYRATSTLGRGTISAQICRSCGFVRIPSNARDYSDVQTTKEIAVASRRAGLPDRRGREFAMAQFAVRALGRSNLDVLIFGAGASVDNQHIEQLPQVASVSIADIVQVRDDAPFVDITKPVTRTFDLVIACEVVEHFNRPRQEFAQLIEYLAPDGVLVCSTNIHGGERLDRMRYPFSPGHVAYYTPKALRWIATKNNIQMQFRPVEASGKRKRYVIFSRSQEAMDAINDWFGRHVLAPSEITLRAAERRAEARAAAATAAAESASGQR